MAETATPPAPPTTPPPAAPPATPPPVRKLSQAAREAFAGKPTTPTTPATPPPAAPPAAKPTPPPAAAAPVKPTTPPAVPVRRAKGYDRVPPGPSIDDAAADKIGAALAKSTAALIDQRSKPADPADKLSEDQTETIANLERMAELYPKKYTAGGVTIAARTKQYLVELPAFEQRWKAAHPPFDAKKEDNEFESEKARLEALDEAKENLRDEYDVDWDDADYLKATSDRAISPLKKELDETRQKLTAFEKDAEMRALNPVAEKAAKDAADAVEPLLREAFAAENLLAADAKPDKLHRAVLKDASKRVSQFAHAATYLFSGKETPLSPAVMDVFNRMEAEMSELPPESLARNGKWWLPVNRFLSLKPEQQRQYYVLGLEDLIGGYQRYLVGDAVEYLKGFEDEAPPADGAAAVNGEDTPPNAKPQSPATVAPPLSGGSTTPPAKGGVFRAMWKE